MPEFNTIGVIGRVDNQQAIYSLRTLIKFLNDRQVRVIIEENTASVLTDHRMEEGDKQLIGEQCDLVMVVGGDGSMLRAASLFGQYDVPLLGINQGRLGFLTDITPKDVEVLVGEVLNGKYLAETRFMLGMSVFRGEENLGGGEALNDVVIHPGKFIRMIELDLFIDDQFVYSQRSDGIIVATPTGSTAYALSAGGPLVHPKLDAVVLVPMNPHTLSSRSIVVDGSSDIKIVVGEHNSAFPHVTCDGHTHVVTEPGDEIRIHKHPWKLRLIHPVSHDFYDTCRSKLGWESRWPKKT